MAPNELKQGRVGGALAALIVTALAALSAAPASATSPPAPRVEGTATISLAGLQRGNARELPVVDLDLGRTAVARTSGVLKLSLQGRRAKLRKLVLRISDDSASVSARLGKERLVFFRAEGEAKIDGSSAKLGKAPLSLTGAGAAALRERLQLDSVDSGEAGMLSVNARIKRFNDKVVALPAPPAGISLEGDALPAKPEEPKPADPYPYAAECPVKAASGPPGFGDEPGQSAGIAPAPVFDAGTSQPVTGTAIEWGFLQSFRNYVLNVPPSGSLQTLDGASASAAGPGMAASGQFFGFPVDAGTYEPGTEPDRSDDRLVADGAGTVLFCKSGHGFNVVLRDPTVTIDGDGSRITADVGTNMHGTWYPFQRVDLAGLDLSSVEPTLSDGGNTIAWEDVPVQMSADGAAATGLGGQYPAGTTLDTITVQTTLDRPQLAECGVEAGIATPPAVDFTLADLPTFTDPLVRSGKGIGTINWGFRRATRGTVAGPGGSFLPLGGATEAFPGSMGGGTSLPPSGGIGKFFRFPISSYAYEAGTVDPGDDRLIATSNATVGFCKPNTASGNYGLIVSKPTLIVDGGDSRIVANAYSFAGPFMGGPAMGWAGGRVELVDLDTSSIDTTIGAGTVRWGEVNPDFEALQSGIPVEGGLKTEALSRANLTIAGTAGGGFDPVAAQIVLPAP